ncbi:hypothetical protein [Streptomyces phage JXY1]|jgi:hypothetical protein|uniref:Uncharacterized protein n=2 Tax=Manuelvirus JXY1 TaxID=2846400 RepID=A0A6C0RTZ0_9CAUD|nr:hypothetical protein HWD10_gp61 [Streptomyces phage JXY1]QIA28816.1 hypothetical protein [Streptomyces phage JXY1]QNN98947.1 hypothetical protein SEA_ZEIGLE_4 [Streptomyces phage Zeigle]WNA15433.1 hypothetical protein SEA_KUMQUAT_4 [Streptomyces phage Kumquat]
MALCWHCKRSEYHDYEDRHGIRCPLCGQKEKDDPAKRPVVKTAKKTASRSKV